MGLELAKAFVSVRVDSRGLSQDFQTIKGQISDQLKGVATAAAGVVGAFGGFGAAVLGQGLKAASEFEQAEVKMATLLGSADEAKETLAKLTQFAVKTPFEMPSIIQVANQMINAGERGDQLMETLEMLGDASGGNEEQFRALALIFNQVRGMGKLLGGDFNQLAQRGLLSASDMAKAPGTTTEGFYQMREQGKVSFEDFKRALKATTEEGGRNFKMAEKQSQTLSGLVSTFSDAKNIAIQFLAQPLVPHMKSLVDSAIVAAGVMESFARTSGEVASFAFTAATAVSSLTAGLVGLQAASRLLGIGKLALVLGGGLAVGVIAAAAGIGVLIAKLRENAQAMQAFGEIGANVGAAFKEVWANLEGPVSYVGGLVKGVFDGAINQIVRFADWLSLMTTNWKLTWELMKTNTNIALLTMGQAGLVLFDTLKAGAIAGVITIIQIFKDLASAIVHIFNVIVATGTLIWRNLGESISLVFQSVVQFAKGIFLGLWKAIKSGFSGGDIIGPFVDEFNRQIAQIDPMSAKMQQDAQELFGGIDTQMPDIMGNASKTFLDTFNSHLGDDTPFGEQLAALKQQADDLKSQMSAERDILREARASGALPEGGTVLEKQPVTPATQAAAKAKELALEQGKYGFTQLGDKIQDLLFKGGKDKQDQTNNLLQKNNEYQRQLVEQGRNQPALALTAES